MIRSILLLSLFALFVGALEGAFAFHVGTRTTVATLRGGSTENPSEKTSKKKKRKRKKPKTEEEALEEEKKMIGDALRETDAETALGDAIR